MPTETKSPKDPEAAPPKVSSKAAQARSSTAAAKERVGKKQAAVPRVSARPAAIPPILFEGDHPSPSADPAPSGPGQRYALRPGTPGRPPGDLNAGGELPESYGTQRLFLTARDPHWLYAAWDLTTDQRRKYNALSADGHLIVRTFAQGSGPQAQVETHVHPESRNWFIHVGRGGTSYVAELGYRDKKHQWQSIATSHSTVTPPESLSDDTSVEFATIPAALSLARVLEMIQQIIPENVPLIEAVQQLRSEGHKSLPQITVTRAAAWKPQQARALAQVVTMDSMRRVWMGSLEITELVRRRLEQDISSQAAAQFSISGQGGPGPGRGAVASVSSPLGGGEQPKDFWFNVNAELIIYGATHPDARVAIGGRSIQLRPDGSFSFRFALPDGSYELPVVAVSPQGDDSREARLQFSRKTDQSGEVGAHPQDARLKRPHPDSVN